MGRHDITIPIRYQKNFTANELYGPTALDAMNLCMEKGQFPAYLYQILDARSKAIGSARILETDIISASLFTWGQSPEGNYVVAIVHDPAGFPLDYHRRKPNRVEAIGLGTEKKFHALLRMEDGQKVTVFDLPDFLKLTKKDKLKTKNALEHAVYRALCSEADIAEAYLKRHQNVYGANVNIIIDDIERIVMAESEPAAYFIRVSGIRDKGAIHLSTSVMKPGIMLGINGETSPRRVPVPTLDRRAEIFGKHLVGPGFEHIIKRLAGNNTKEEDIKIAQEVMTGESLRAFKEDITNLYVMDLAVFKQFQPQKPSPRQH